MRSSNQSSPRQTSPTRKRLGWASARILPLVLVLVFIALGIAGGAFWYFRTAGAGNGAGEAHELAIRLSDSTRTALKDLNSPVDIRFYSLLGKAGRPESLGAFAGRVDQLLSEYERVAGGNIIVTRYKSGSEADLDAASSDGIRAFNLDKGEANYLGLSVAQEEHKESLPRITPEWEQALEADLTRAILRVSGAQSLAEQADATTQADAAAFEEVKRSLPNFDSVSVEDAREILRERARKELKEASAEMQPQIQGAQQRFREAQAAKSEAGQKAAKKQLQQAQAAQVDLLKEIAARLQAEITAVERLKGVNPAR